MCQPAYTHPLRIRLHDTDAAGVLFYGHLFRHAHDAYESFMEHLGCPLSRLIGPGGAACTLPLPIIRAEADYARPLRLGDRVRVEVRVGELRRRSFALEYRFLDDQGRVCASARTVHCRIGGAGEPGIELPPELHRALGACLAGA